MHNEKIIGPGISVLDSAQPLKQNATPLVIDDDMDSA
jgi:hypothetical protein